jgi:hypothetical protein
MTPELLEKRVKSMTRFGRFAFFGPALLAVGPLLFFCVCDVCHWHVVDKETGLYIVLAGVFGFFPVVGILAYSGERRYQVLCPHCGQSLVSQYPVILSTKTCRFCREVVIDESAQ